MTATTYQGMETKENCPFSERILWILPIIKLFFSRLWSMPNPYFFFPPNRTIWRMILTCREGGGDLLSKDTVDELQELSEHLNFLNPTIKFKWEPGVHYYPGTSIASTSRTTPCLMKMASWSPPCKASPTRSCSTCLAPSVTWTT